MATAAQGTVRDHFSASRFEQRHHFVEKDGVMRKLHFDNAPYC